MPPQARAQKPSKNKDKLIAAARGLMAEKGYADTATEDIVAKAGITRGALYYQFADKKDLFEAVFQELLEEVAHYVNEETMRRVSKDTEDLEVSSRLLLDVFARQDVKQIILQDGPAVLGIDRCRELQNPLYMYLATHSLEHLVEAGIIPQQPLEPLAELICGALMQAAQGIAQSDDPKSAIESYDRALQQLYRGILKD